MTDMGTSEEAVDALCSGGGLGFSDVDNSNGSDSNDGREKFEVQVRGGAHAGKDDIEEAMEPFDLVVVASALPVRPALEEEENEDKNNNE